MVRASVSLTIAASCLIGADAARVGSSLTLNSSKPETCAGVRDAMVGRGINLDDVEFGTLSPFQNQWTKSVTSDRKCFIPFERMKMDIGGCDNPAQWSNCRKEIEADMAIQCPTETRTTEDGRKVSCRAQMPKSKLFGPGFSFYIPAPFYKAMCVCETRGTETRDPVTCDGMTKLMGNLKDARKKQPVVQASCTVRGFVDRLSPPEKYESLTPEQKALAWPINLAFPAEAAKDEANILFFVLGDEIGSWRRNRGSFKGKSVEELKEQLSDEEKLFDWFEDMKGMDDDIAASEATLRYFAKVAQPIVASLSSQDDAKRVENEIFEAQQEMKNGIRVSKPASEARMTKEGCTEVMAEYGCGADMVTFSAGKSARSKSVEYDVCRCASR
eukprot:TRINITY_DN4756_c0_g1_i3.p1 TRINITY_DN4756_c0_g1~~TRINITY_DN4756_c0_g1_i3.p1  ORF type:complete len:402 (+),score=95.93 TRINITY_DN4756_c0_g1_i3:49-1206(+)